LKIEFCTEVVSGDLVFGGLKTETEKSVGIFFLPFTFGNVMPI
jgi:hypothetical protein